MPRRSRDRRRRSPSPSESSSVSLTPDAHADYEHEEFVDKVQETRNSMRWANRRTSLQKRDKGRSMSASNNTKSHKSAARVNQETADEERTLRDRRRREEEYARRKKEKEEQERKNRERERFNQSQERTRTHESTYSGRSTDHFPVDNDINDMDFKLMRQHSEPDYADYENYQEEFMGGNNQDGMGGARRAPDVEQKGACQSCIIL